MHEASLHKHNSFITLTYAPEHLPRNGSLTKRDHQLFLKRLRKALGNKTGAFHHSATSTETQHAVILRYYMCGEYGQQLGRPHYHFCLFGIQFADLKYWRTTPAGSKIYRSTTLEKLWPYGFSTVGELTFESAAYTARYVMKKINGKQKEKHYEKIDKETGEIHTIQPEYNEMSRAQGIGKGWIEKYTADVYQALPGKIIVNGKLGNSPRYYDKHLENTDPDRYEIIREHRQREGRKHLHDNTPRRRAAKEIVTLATLKQLKRNI